MGSRVLLGMTTARHTTAYESDRGSRSCLEPRVTHAGAGAAQKVQLALVFVNSILSSVLDDAANWTKA